MITMGQPEKPQPDPTMMALAKALRGNKPEQPEQPEQQREVVESEGGDAE